jgi:hypothetical protein
MVNIYSVIVEGVDRPDCSSLATKFQMLKGRCRIILQVTWENCFFHSTIFVLFFVFLFFFFFFVFFSFVLQAYTNLKVPEFMNKKKKNKKKK